MKVGISKVDITPPAGYELAGLGMYRGRYATEVLAPLHASALAVEDGGGMTIVISCELLNLVKSQVAQIRAFISDATGLGPDKILVCCTHTHSGPAVAGPCSWGVPHPPYVENLPWRIAQAGIQAYGALGEATVRHAEVPCKDIAYNRVLNRKPDRATVGQPGWSDQLLGPTDRTAHVVKFMSRDRMIGFFSYYSCHPTVCCEGTHSIHGGFVGVATNAVEKRYQEAKGFFLQGASGDIDPGYSHESQETSMENLRVMSGRYAEAVERGLAEAMPLEGGGVVTARRVVHIPQVPPQRGEVKAKIQDIERWLNTPDAESNRVEGGCSRVINLVKNNRVAELAGLRKMLAVLDKDQHPAREVELMAVRFGGITLVSSPFELYNGIKRRVQANLAPKRVLVLGLANDYAGYAPVASDYENDGRSGRGYSYEAYFVPTLMGEPPFGPHLEQRLVDEMTALAREVNP